VTNDSEHIISISIVEDDEDLRRILAAALGDFGFDVRDYPGSREFYRDLWNKPCSIAILDINLPGEDGFSILEHLRASSDIGVIMLTARNQKQDRLQALTQGADVYLTKPVDLDELVANIANLSRRICCPTVSPRIPTNSWKLSADRWSLFAPNGKIAALTASERAILGELLDHMDEAVTRDALVEALGHASDYLLPNRLDMLISRLRRNVLALTGCQLPLRTIRGIGFSLLSDPKE
jgi:two-component system, OmpR family, response regulator PhoP